MSTIEAVLAWTGYVVLTAGIGSVVCVTAAWLFWCCWLMVRDFLMDVVTVRDWIRHKYQYEQWAEENGYEIPKRDRRTRLPGIRKWLRSLTND